MAPIDYPIVLGLVSVSLQALIAAQLFSIARAPGWLRARSFAWVVATAALYGVIYTTAAAHVVPPEAVGVRIAAYLIAGTANAAAWLWFARVPDVRRWNDVPRTVSWHIAAVAAVVGVLAAAGQLVDASRTVHVTAETLGADYERPLMSLGGRVAALLAVSLYVAAGRALWHRRDERGMPLVVAGYIVFLANVVLELGIGVSGWPLLLPAPVGFLIAVVPVGLQLQHRFRRDSERLAWLSSSLQGQLASRTEERDAARDALVRQEQVASIGRLASGLAHELSNPLQHVALAIGELEALPSMTSGQERRLLHDTAAGVDRMQNIVHRLHDLVEHAEWHREQVVLVEAVRHAVALTAPHWREVATVHIEDERVPMVSGNEAAVVRALTALLINAAEAVRRVSTDRTPEITVRVAVTADGLPSIEVQDNGPGFPEEVIALAGEPFVTAGETPGLGLFLVYRIMHAHGGRALVGNRAGHGARVALLFPSVGVDALAPVTAGDAPIATIPGRATAVAAGEHGDNGENNVHDSAATPPQPAHASSSAVATNGSRSSPLSAAATSATILVVDDEPLVRNAFARVLERAGHHVLRAGDGREALNLLRSDIVDLVITDLMMPGMNGVEFAGVLAEGYPSLRQHLIVVCGGAVTQDAVHFLNTPGLRVLNKPVSMTDLVGVVTAALAERGVSGRGAPASLRP
jgi:signal transduction histidine kinase/CheY-like chemotaxis protein